MVTIFLDIDGVLATDKEFMRNSEKFKETKEWARKLDVPYPFNPQCVEIFNEILSTTECQIILSSDWRISWTLEELDIIFKENGVKQSPVGITEKNLYCNIGNYNKKRASEIEFYIQENRIKDWIILDDLNIHPYFPGRKKNNIFKTEDREGLKKTGIKEKIIRRLQRYAPVAEQVDALDLKSNVP